MFATAVCASADGDKVDRRGDRTNKQPDRNAAVTLSLGAKFPTLTLKGQLH